LDVPIGLQFAGSRLGECAFYRKKKSCMLRNIYQEWEKHPLFIGRPGSGYPSLISIPAGLARMSFRDFMLFTFIGAGIWNIILAIIGFYLYACQGQIFHT